MEGGKPVLSPCISVCLLNDKDVCMGCYRNTQEIASWAVLCNEQRRQIIIKTQLRRADSNTIFLS